MFEGMKGFNKNSQIWDLIKPSLSNIYRDAKEFCNPAILILRARHRSF